MADYAAELAGWYAWFTQFSIVPSEYQYVMRMISAFFITLGLVPIVPIILLFIYDLGLWLFRLAAAARRRQEIMRIAGSLEPVVVAAALCAPLYDLPPHPANSPPEPAESPPNQAEKTD